MGRLTLIILSFIFCHNIPRYDIYQRFHGMLCCRLVFRLQPLLDRLQPQLTYGLHVSFTLAVLSWRLQIVYSDSHRRCICCSGVPPIPSPSTWLYQIYKILQRVIYIHIWGDDFAIEKNRRICWCSWRTKMTDCPCKKYPRMVYYTSGPSRGLTIPGSSPPFSRTKP